MGDKSDYISFLENISDKVVKIAMKTTLLAVNINNDYYIKSCDIIDELADVIDELNVKRFDMLWEDENDL